jgi:methionyl-tRNA formyltransferase
MTKKKLVFMGTMEFAVPILEALRNVYDICLVVTQPDKPFGRKQELKYSPVKEVALHYQIPLFQPVQIRTDYQPILDCLPDAIIVCAYGQMIPSIVLETPPFQAINVHASLLPKLRGGAPMHKAIQYGEEYTGVSVMFMRPKMDSGPILSQQRIQIELTDNVGTLQTKLAHLGAQLLMDTLPRVFDQSITPMEQDITQVTYAYNIKPIEESLHFHQTIRQVYDHVRGYYPWPIVHTTMDQVIYKIYEVEMIPENINFYQGALCGEIVKIIKQEVYVLAQDGLIKLVTIQPSGKKPMSIKDFMNGAGKQAFQIGKKFE